MSIAPRLPQSLLPAIAVTVALGVLGPTGIEAQEAPPPAEGSAPASANVPFFLKGVDLSLPAQEAFRGWPPEEVVSGDIYWFQWGIPAFQKADLFGRPLLLVLHVPWSRFSQRLLTETLKDPEVVRTINAGFILVIVDADRRPDIRERYQSGSWPVVSFLLPDGKPMISAANPTATPGPIVGGLMDPSAMLFMLEQARSYYSRNAPSLSEQGTKWAQLDAAAKPKGGSVAREVSEELVGWLLAGVDRTDGGFGLGPKFLLPGLMEYAAVRADRGEGALEEPARFMLDKLLGSPLYDRRHGGMHRMAMTPSWKGVQYEKMLEANAQLLRELVFRARRGGSEDLEAAIRGTARFLTTVLARPGGGFFLAQNADPRSPDGGGYWEAADGQAEPPPLDRLVLSGANALAGAALLRAGSHLSDDAMEKAGRDALDLVLARAYVPGRGVGHVIEPNPDERRHLSDQAEAAFGFADAFETTGEPKYLEAARDIILFCTRNLLSPGETAVRDSLPDVQPLGILGNARRPLRENALLARAMLRVHALGGGEDLREQAVSILGSFTGDMASYGAYGIGTALAVEEALEAPMTIRIEGAAGDPRARTLRRAAAGVPCLWSVVGTAPGDGRKVSATISWRGETRKAATPERLAQQVRELMSPEPSKGRR